MTPVEIVVVAFWTMLPAYVPNNAAVVFGGGRPIDDGRTWDGSRVLGDGKTWRGVAGGTLTGAVLALLLNAIEPVITTATALSVPAFPPFVILTLPFGAMAGDVVASFFKRRVGRERGAAFPGVDQLDFVLGALSLTALFAFEWFVETFTLPVLVTVLLVTPLLHVGTNIVAYRAGLKSEPW